jgi:2-desacetyl-2-hydroxyethyl bacteriochlorophyllide A dehydrogenase
MRAVRLTQVGHPLELQEIPIPAVDDFGVLVRVKAAGICHSDVHYRGGTSPAYPLPLTLGHEVAGVVEQVGSRVTRCRPGERVCLHYMLTCGSCYYCTTGSEQFCESGKMIGHYTDGGYADYISVPERSVLPLPAEIPFEPGATLMCASATSLHALRKGRLKGGETVAIFGAGGLGMSAIQLARALGARQVFAVDLNPAKLALAEEYGARPINAAHGDPAAEIKRLTSGRGADVAIELIGLPQTMKQALRSLSVFGRAVMVGITTRVLEVDTYHELLGPETELIGSNDHLLQELPLLLELARSGALDTRKIVSRTVPLEAGAINAVLDELEHFAGESVRTVIVP